MLESQLHHLGPFYRKVNPDNEILNNNKFEEKVANFGRRLFKKSEKHYYQLLRFAGKDVYDDKYQLVDRFVRPEITTEYGELQHIYETNRHKNASEDEASFVHRFYNVEIEEYFAKFENDKNIFRFKLEDTGYGTLYIIEKGNLSNVQEFNFKRLRLYSLEQYY